jgi:uncharacterized protein with PIN domain
LSSAFFRFYAELNDFLPDARRQVEFAHSFIGGAAVKDLIEGLGVPHTEVDLILVNGESVAFSHRVGEGDRVSVYPVFEAFDISGFERVRPSPLRELKFALDTHLGRLARFLRMLGFDVAYSNQVSDEGLAALSAGGGRVLLTRDRGLLKRGEVTHGYLVRATEPFAQLEEVVDRFQLASLARPFERCLRCNGLLEPVPKAEVESLIPPRVSGSFSTFRRCSGCGRVYWPGSHYESMLRVVARCIGGESGGGG